LILGKKLNHNTIGDEFRNYQQNCLQHVKGMAKNRLPKLALRYQPHGKRNIGCPRRRWREQDYLKASELHRRGLAAPNIQDS
jgi:hypothetical protein